MASDTETESAGSQSWRLRVLLFSTQLGWGGGEEQTRLTVRGLCAASCDVLTVAPAGSAIADQLRRSGFPVCDVAGRGRGLTSWLTIRRLIRWFCPHVFFMNDPHAIIHGGLASVGLRTVRIGARRTVFPLRSGWLYRWLLDGIICSSQAAAEACREAKIPARRINVIYDGVDLQRIRSADATRGRKSLYQLMNNGSAAGHDRNDGENGIRFIVHVGKLTPAKGQEDLIAAFAGLAPSFPELVLVIVGDGELRPHLETRVSVLGLEKRVLFSGFRKDVLDLVAAADLFVFPSREEGLGGALIEALLLAVPVVASSAGGIPEILNGDPPLGAVAPPANPDALRQAMQETLSLSQEQRTMATSRARRIAEERFSDQQLVRQLKTLFQEMVFSRV
jgi:glycosyltransferase involved in cell wall biosynthesis